MGTLRELTSEDRNTHLIVTNSGLAEMYVYDKLKKRCHATLESVYEINRVSEFKDMLETINLEPYMADKWLFTIDYSKLKSTVDKYLHIFDAETACFIIKCKGYKDFKDFKQGYPKANDLYLSIIRSGDIQYLLSEFNLSQKIVDFVSKSYSRDPEKVFTLYRELCNGAEINTSKDIVELCGVSTGSVVSLVMLLLADPPKTSKGFNRVLKKRIQIANDLVGAYGLSTFRNFLVSSIKDILDIKILYLQGIIYKSIRDLPECYDEKKLSRYNPYLFRIVDEIPVDRILRLYISVRESGFWRNKSSVVQFMYDYYGGYCDENISEL